MTLWRCGVCGYLHDGDDAPDKCPKCGAPKEKFSRVSDEEAALITKARKTNYLHMKLTRFLVKIRKYAEAGIHENLDPACVSIFNRIVKDSHENYQSILAELETHMKKKKWG
ncbi:rubredoxin [Candidatus Woesearchaeota archaeon]|nr:MAG: rubredoxin [Candidatus Woesearchaeota archaeon]